MKMALSNLFAVAIREGGKRKGNSFKEKQNDIIFRLTDLRVFKIRILRENMEAK